MSPRKQTALITGATAGIGREFANQLAAADYDLVLVARNHERLETTQAALHRTYGVNVATLGADLTDRAQLDTVAERLRATAEPVDLLINNAGFGLKERFIHNDIAIEQAQLDVLVTAVMRLSHAALTTMVARGSGGIINVSSVAGFLPRGTYSAAKAYVTSLSQWAHQEHAADGVKVMALCPGFVRTEFHQRMGVGRDSAPEFMWLKAPEVVQIALKDWRKGKAVCIPGYQYKAVTAITRYLPAGLLQRFQTLGRK